MNAATPQTATHTPGPWRAVVRSNQRGPRYVAVDMAPRSRSWHVYGQGVGVSVTLTEQDVADARLIAAAPELLDALRDLLMHCGIADASPEDKDEIDHRYERAARAAIAKATGAA